MNGVWEKSRAELSRSPWHVRHPSGRGERQSGVMKTARVSEPRPGLKDSVSSSLSGDNNSPRGCCED